MTVKWKEEQGKLRNLAAKGATADILAEVFGTSRKVIYAVCSKYDIPLDRMEKQTRSASVHDGYPMEMELGLFDHLFTPGPKPSGRYV